jgi:hypothetical protein
MRKGDYCISHIENMRDNECITEKRYQELKDWGVFREGNSEISELSEAACTPLIREKDLEVKAKAIETLGKQIEHGNIATAKQVKTIIDNIRARVPTKGGDHKGAVNPEGNVQSGYATTPNQPELTMNDFISDKTKDEVSVDSDLDLVDEEQDYYSGEMLPAPDDYEKLEDTVVQKQPVVTRDPEVIKTVVADKLEEERMAQEVRDLRKKKESENHTQKDEMERDGLAEDSISIRIYVDLVETLTACFKEAIQNGLQSERVDEAINDALNIAFQARADTPENLGITEYTKGELDIQKLKALAEKKKKWAREDIKKEEEQ